MKVSFDIKELESFLIYLQDKIDDVYKAETDVAIKSFLKDKGLSKCKANISTEYL